MKIPNMFAIPLLLFFVAFSSSSMLDMIEMQEMPDIRKIMDESLKDYNKNVRPKYGFDPVTVGVSIYVLAIHEISDSKREMSFEMYFRQFWRDERLAFEKRPSFNKIVYGGSEKLDQIWQPDTFIVNQKSAEEEEDSRTNSFLRILHDGEILLSRKKTVTVSCPMDLSNFPMDSQLCSFEFESFGYTMSDIRYKWNDGLNSVQVGYDVSVPNFRVIGHRQRLVEASLSSGNYSRLLVDIQIQRDWSQFNMKYFYPAGLLVACSWLTFLVRSNARLVFSILPLLSLIFLEILATQEIEGGPQWKALDVYIASCAVLVLTSCVVSGLFDALERVWKVIKSSDPKNDGDGFGKFQLIVDISSLVIFPVSFLVFNNWFWKSYPGTVEPVDDLIKM